MNARPPRNSKPLNFSAATATARDVLIVEENEMIRDILCRIVQSWGLVPHTAARLIDACRAVVTEGPFDVIICNYDLPDGNAYNLVDWIHEQGLEVPTLVPYGTLMPTSAPHHREVKLLAKPFDPVDLRAAIENLTHCRLCGSERGTRLQQKTKA